MTTAQELGLLVLKSGEVFPRADAQILYPFSCSPGWLKACHICLHLFGQTTKSCFTANQPQH